MQYIVKILNITRALICPLAAQILIFVNRSISVDTSLQFNFWKKSVKIKNCHKSGYVQIAPLTLEIYTEYIVRILNITRTLIFPLAAQILIFVNRSISVDTSFQYNFLKKSVKIKIYHKSLWISPVNLEIHMECIVRILNIT